MQLGDVVCFHLWCAGCSARAGVEEPMDCDDSCEVQDENYRNPSNFDSNQKEHEDCEKEDSDSELHALEERAILMFQSSAGEPSRSKMPKLPR